MSSVLLHRCIGAAKLTKLAGFCVCLYATGTVLLRLVATRTLVDLEDHQQQQTRGSIRGAFLFHHHDDDDKPPAPSSTASDNLLLVNKEKDESNQHTILTLEFNNLDDNDCGFLDMFSFTISELTSGGEYVVISPTYSHFPPGISSKSFELPSSSSSNDHDDAGAGHGGSSCYVVQSTFNAAYTCDSSLEAIAHFEGVQYSTTKHSLFVGNGCPSGVVAAAQQQEEEDQQEEEEKSSASSSSLNLTASAADRTNTGVSSGTPPEEQQKRRGAATPEARADTK